nr:hypothetical protein CFP56_45154 [Quercus suber]
MPPSNNKSMMMNTRPGRIGGNCDESKTPATPMMMNNHASDVADSDLMDLFAYYAFVFFKRIEVTKAAKDTLKGVDLHGHPIKSKSDSEAGIGSGGANAEEEESGSKIGRQEPGLSEVAFLRSCSLIAGLLGL